MKGVFYVLANVGDVVPEVEWVPPVLNYKIV